MSVLEAKSENQPGQTSRAEELSLKPGRNRRVLEMVRKKSWAEKSLEDSLSSALQAADSEFGEILGEVDEIFRLLKAPKPDKAALRIAEHPAVWCAMKQALVDRELRQLAVTDDLTCLFNRRGFFAAAIQELRRAMRKTENLLLFFCDVDDLKMINDTYGHQEGDLALIRVADALEKTFRGSDVVARLGGDEFVVLALEANEQSEQLLRRRLTKNLKKNSCSQDGYELSVSISAARFDPKHAVALGELMVQADKAMYEQKRKRHIATTSRDANTVG
jgi:diguanylate cyclase (GGDEF)-like protein